MTDAQQKVLNWLRHEREGSSAWFRPSDIRPDDYAGSATAIGLILRVLVEEGTVEVGNQDRGNGTQCRVYRALRTWRSSHA